MRLLPVVLVVLRAVAGENALQDDFTQHLRAGIDQTGRGDFSGAMAELQIALRLNPLSPDVYYRIGLLLGQTGDFRNAEVAFRHAIELKPTFADAYYNLGITLIANPKSKLNWPDAIAAFRNALRLRPSYAEASNYLGTGLLATGDIDGALHELERAAQLSPGLPEVHFNLATALEQKDRLDEAEKEYKLAINARQMYPEASTALAKLLLRESKTPEAEQALASALREDPDAANAHYLMARVLRAQQKTAAADVELDEAKELAARGPRDIEAATLTNQGLESATRGDMASALKLEQQAVALKPEFGVAHHNLGLILADRAEWKAAEQELIKAASLLPGRAEPWFDLGRVRRQRGDLQSAHTMYAWAARLAPSDQRISAELRSVEAALTAAGQVPPLAEAGIRPVLGAKADTAPEHLAFAQTLLNGGDYLGASGELLRVLALDPANVEARVSLAQAYLRLGKKSQAALEFHKVLLVAPDNAEAKEALVTWK